jgi:hypothetical protein
LVRALLLVALLARVLPMRTQTPTVTGTFTATVAVSPPWQTTQQGSAIEIEASVTLSDWVDPMKKIAMVKKPV